MSLGLVVVSLAMPYYILTYQTTPDFIEAREPFRKQHLQWVQKWFQEQKLILGGALKPPYQEAILIFKTATENEIHAFAKADPYVQNNLIPSYNIKEWNVVIGDQHF